MCYNTLVQGRQRSQGQGMFLRMIMHGRVVLPTQQYTVLHQVEVCTRFAPG
jgi:hypothetical protein